MSVWAPLHPGTPVPHPCMAPTRRSDGTQTLFDITPPTCMAPLAADCGLKAQHPRHHGAWPGRDVACTHASRGTSCGHAWSQAAMRAGEEVGCKGSIATRARKPCALQLRTCRKRRPHMQRESGVAVVHHTLRHLGMQQGLSVGNRSAEQLWYTGKEAGRQGLKQGTLRPNEIKALCSREG